MDDRTRATATAATMAARELLQGYKEEHPGWIDDRTPVDDVVSWLGLEVETFHPNDYPQGTYGFLEPGEDLVWLCRDLSPTLRRFTLAHELGHVVLHRGSGQASISGDVDMPDREGRADRVGMFDRPGASPESPPG